MENFDQIFTLLAEHEGHEGIGLNTDILETGLINILAVIVILAFSGRNFLGSYLKERKNTIIEGIEDAKNRLNEAQKRLIEAEKQFNQANLIISEIRNEATATKEVLLESDASQAQNDLTIRFERALANIKSKERQIFLEIKQEIISIVLQRTVRRMTHSFRSKERATKLINESINKLEGDLL